ncbi:carboxymuconolactone decarboxylase family protein [Methylobacterium sp. SyP6R]|uniref:carboxymuconolactone decarboxylase family protein n=1 Tax=Methylobacterium sp. SyP6R TaxID=2718876 RepID=UPI001F1A8671|nr:carboxymuconolactone decarboxylase family protein [Methylobacterium sp. SyP6R]MCF4129883.1 carboxymuconolactone decarboxylase family protein [Methylobacterium sp. SyP6R]
MRLPPIASADLTDRQRPLYDDMRSGVAAKYDLFTTMRNDGALLGPWNAWLHQPEVGAAFWTVTRAMTAFQILPDAARQVAILAVGARFGAAYEIYAHGAVAQARHAMGDQRLATLAAGERPPDLTDEEATAFDVARALTGGGVLPEPTYRRAVALFGQAGANELIYLVGHYCFVSVTLNGFAIPVPGDEPAGTGERP